MAANAAQLHHHALYESGRLYCFAALPSSLRFIRWYAATAGNRIVAPVGAALGALAVIALLAPGTIPGL